MVMVLALAAAPPPSGSRIETVTVFRSLTIRMPLRRRSRPPAATAMVEKRGPRCIPLADIAGAAVAGPGAVDFALRGGVHVRAKLEDTCPALGYYGGFYMDRREDGKVCADRDAIHTRAGGECGIDRFRRLEPPKPGKP